MLQQVKDLENTISNLRTLLTSRENEVTELKDQFSEVRKINDKLQGDLDRHRARASPGPQIAEVKTMFISRGESKKGLSVYSKEAQDENLKLVSQQHRA